MTGLEVIFVEIDDRTFREKVIDDLATENSKAKRMLRRDNQGRENEAWAQVHEWMNELLDLLED